MNMYNDVVEIDKKESARLAIIFARVSSKDQEDGYSLEAQNHRGETYCARRNLEIIKVFELVESSTIADRRKFMEMIAFVKAQKETIAIIADKVDRVQRSLKEFPLLEDLVDSGKIELHFITENYVIHQHSKSHEKTVWSLGVIFAKSYVDSLRDNVKRSIAQKIRMGEWVAYAPIGYMNARDEYNRGTVLVDPERAPLVRRLFEEYSKGTCTVGQLTKMSKAWGLKGRTKKAAYLGKSKVYQILNNPFYYGRMVIKGKEYNHRYPPLIDKQLFDKCQSNLKGWHQKPYRQCAHDLIFRGLLTCAVSGRMVTSDRKQKIYANGNIGEWIYLLCRNPADVSKIMWVREDAVLLQARDALKGFEMPSAQKERVIEYIKNSEENEQEFKRTQLNALQRELTVIQSRSDVLLNLLLDQQIDKAEFEMKKQKLRDGQRDLENRITALSNGNGQFKKSLSALILLVPEMLSLFIASNASRKRELLKIVFSNLSLHGCKLLYSFNKPFDKFANCVNFEEWRDIVDAIRSDPELRTQIENIHYYNIINDLLHQEPPCSE